ncbi:MAG TPA: 3-deoxy-8-phosphooctulonate synthase [Candidatus Polarisedimenticolia bacterium]|nr:3-deoxy-8-phosphooctulonate synthase [Candidatus Polarisedimenticolia bacterium]
MTTPAPPSSGSGSSSAAPRRARVAGFEVGEGRPMALIAGPCVIEKDDLMLRTAETLASMAQRLKLPLIFKSSYEKDNRSTSAFYRGPGIEAGLALLRRVKERFGLPVTSDVHRETDMAAAADVLDVIQIPAYLCQQTSLVEAAGRTGRPVNVKKGQFLAPHNMASAVGKLRGAGCRDILVTERGSSFGYNRLVNDFTAIPVMKGLGVPVVYDATHSVRLYGTPSKDPRGGEPQFIPTLARAGVAAGCDALFMETHPDPPSALCDAASQFPLGRMEWMLSHAIRLSEIVREAEAAR